MQCSVDIERNPQIMLRHRNTLKSYSSTTQTETSLQDAFSQTLSEINEKVLMLDVAVQTLESHLEPDSVPPQRLKEECGPPESVKMKAESESESTKNIQELLEAAMISRVDTEYPCNICQKQFSSLYQVKLHLIESHDEKKHNSNTQPSINNNNNNLTRKKKIKKMKKKFTAKKKPWCNYCWLKFKDIKQYQLHRKTLHPNLSTQPGPVTTATTTEPDSQPREGEPKTVSLHDKGEEGEEIVDRPVVLNVESSSSKVPLIKYERGDSTGRNQKRRLISLSSQEDQEANSPIKSIKLIKNKDSEGYTTISSPSAHSSAGLSPTAPSSQEHLSEKDPEVHYKLKSNPQVDQLTISRNRPIRQRNDSKKVELASDCPLPLKDLRVILTERVEQVKHIDPSGVYICTELDKLGLSMEDFHQEMDQVFPRQVEETKVEEHDDDERLDLSL